MDSCIRDVEPAENEEQTLVYADDVAVVAKDANSLQEIVNKWNRGMSNNGMKINTAEGKTEYIVISRREEEYEIKMEEEIPL